MQRMKFFITFAKNEVLHHFCTLCLMIKTIFHTNIEFFQSNGGTEYVNAYFQTFCPTNDIVHHVSCPHMPQQNGLAKHKHRHISTITRLPLTTFSAPLTLWMKAALTTTFLINFIPSSVFGWSSPYSRLIDRLLDLSSLRTINCVVIHI